MARPKNGYRDSSGRTLPGVTTILGMLAKPALLHWAFEQGKLAERGEISSLYDKRDEAAATGTLVHDMVEAAEKGQVPELLLAGVGVEQASKAETGFLAYLQWREDSKREVLLTELPLVSDRFAYGGTLDVVYSAKGGVILGDYKTGNQIYSETWLQLAGYAVLWEEHRPEPIVGYQVLRFDKRTGGFDVAYRPEITDWQNAWNALLACYYMMKIAEGK